MFCCKELGKCLLLKTWRTLYVKKEKKYFFKSKCLLLGNSKGLLLANVVY